MKKRGLEERREEIVDFIREHPKATYRILKKELKLNPRRAFKSLEEAYRLAGVKPQRNFKIKTPKEKKRIIIEFIKEHPRAGGHTIRKETKINFSILFKNLEEAYKEAGIEYPRKVDKRKREDKIREIISFVRENPTFTLTEIEKTTKTNLYNLFKSLKETYEKAGIKPVSKGEKRASKKRKKVIQFIKNNPLATQREINNACNTHVQLIFQRGIFEAYEKAGINFPYERLKEYGASQKPIKNRAAEFEEKIAGKLSGYGKVNRLVKTKRGFADIILERKGKKTVIEVKDYEAKEISISQINQLNKYLEDCNCKIGFLVCFKKPKKDNFLIGENKIFVLEEAELSKIPELMEGTVG